MTNQEILKIEMSQSARDLSVATCTSAYYGNCKELRTVKVDLNDKLKFDRGEYGLQCNIAETF